MEDIKFHQCVRLARFENDRSPLLECCLILSREITLIDALQDHLLHPPRRRVRAHVLSSIDTGMSNYVEGED